eukprot:5703406-Pleurochrysis_carterae.AAC.1
MQVRLEYALRKLELVLLALVLGEASTLKRATSGCGFLRDELHTSTHELHASVTPGRLTRTALTVHGLAYVFSGPWLE